MNSREKRKRIELGEVAIYEKYKLIKTYDDKRYIYSYSLDFVRFVSNSSIGITYASGMDGCLKFHHSQLNIS